MHFHVIVAPSPYYKDPLKYRRHRLAEYLSGQQETEQVIWVCPDEKNLAAVFQQPVIQLLENGVVELKVYDYKGAARNLQILQKRLKNKLRLHCKSVGDKRFYLWFTYPAFSGLIDLKIWDKVIYDCSDLWNQMIGGSKFSWIRAISRKMNERTEHKIIEQADQCFASSAFLFSRLARLRPNVKLIENGVDYQRFHDVNLSIRGHRQHIPTVGFVGGLKPWKVNFWLLAELAASRRDWNIAIIGPLYGDETEDFNRLLRQPNVKYTPYVPYDKVPELMQSFDVGLLPYLENEYNQAVFPLKLFEYLAVGVPVVGCGLPSTMNYVEEHVFAHVPGRVSDVIAACESMIAKRNVHIEKRKALARKADWIQKFETVWNEVNH